jgi:hypothetical protein
VNAAKGCDYKSIVLYMLDLGQEKTQIGEYKPENCRNALFFEHCCDIITKSVLGEDTS